MSPLPMFFKNFFFCRAASRRGLFFVKTFILKKMNKFLFHFYIVFVDIFRILVFFFFCLFSYLLLAYVYRKLVFVPDRRLRYL